MRVLQFSTPLNPPHHNVKTDRSLHVTPDFLDIVMGGCRGGQNVGTPSETTIFARYTSDTAIKFSGEKYRKTLFEKHEIKMVAYKNICERLMRLLSQIHIFLPIGLGFYEARAMCVNLLQPFV